MIHLEGFVQQHANTLAEKYQFDFDVTIQDNGLDCFRDYSDLHADIHKLVCEAFGVAEDACFCLLYTSPSPRD